MGAGDVIQAVSPRPAFPMLLDCAEQVVRVRANDFERFVIFALLGQLSLANRELRPQTDLGDAHLVKAERLTPRLFRGASQRLYALPVRRAELDHLVSLPFGRVLQPEREIVPGNVDGGPVFHDEGRVDLQTFAPKLDLPARLARAEDQRNILV